MDYNFVEVFAFMCSQNWPVEVIPNVLVTEAIE